MSTGNAGCVPIVSLNSMYFSDALNALNSAQMLSTISSLAPPPAAPAPVPMYIHMHVIQNRELE